MDILIIPGWLMNTRSFSKAESILSSMGHYVDIFECPGIETADSKLNVSKVINLIRKQIRDNDYDVIIAHSYAVNWLLQMKLLISDKKIILLSPCYDNLKTSLRLFKYLSIFILISKKLPLPRKLIKYVYSLIHTSGETVCDEMIDGYFTCNAISAYRLLIQTLRLKCNKRNVVDSDVLIIHGANDRLLNCKYDNLIKQFKNSSLVKLECGHDTFNYLPDEVLKFISV